MKYYVLTFLLLLFFSCKKSSPAYSPADGEYRGILVISDQTIANGASSPVQRETLLVELTLEGDAFRKPGPEWEDAICEGSVTVESEQIVFSSSDCNCLCNCLGHFDCRGDFILGAHDYRLTADSLILEREAGTSRFIEAAGLTLEVFQREAFLLRKVD